MLAGLGEMTKTASALCGHRFPGWQYAAKSAWNLSPGGWAFVAHHIDRTKEGFRRRWGLAQLRRIARRRRDLCFPISAISFAIPWLGSACARQVAVRAVRRLVHTWRLKGLWVPILRHAKCNVSWSSSRSIRDLLSNSSCLHEWLAARTCPRCPCFELMQQDLRWPSVTVEGVQHVAASQGTVPWPERLQHLASWPASLCLPPRWEDVASAVRDAFRSLRRRCRVDHQDFCTDHAIAECTADLWALFQSQTSSPIPVSWDDISGARTWLRSMFVTVYDHNPTCLAIICPKLAYMQACRLLDFSIPCTAPDIVWKTSNSSVFSEAIADMATIPGLPEFLQPPSLTKVPKSKWQIGTISVLPKWKAPGVKWRLIINKHATPCCYLHSVVSKAIDVLLDSFPMHLWSDFMSVQDVVYMVHDFNSRSDRFAFDCGYTVAADMKDCFRHLPCPDGEVMWSALSDWWRSRNVHGVSVPAMNSGEKGQLGNCTDPGWIYCALESISAVIAHFSKTNFIHIEGFLGRELQGVPQGDALSSAFSCILQLHRF